MVLTILKGNKMIKRIKTGEKHPEGKDAVFIAVVSATELGSEFKGYEGHIAPIIMLQARSRGDFGLPGGKVEEGEEFLDALIREVEEEIGITMEFNEGSEPTLVCSHDIGHMHTHLYAIIAEPMNIAQMMHGAVMAESFITENCGNFVNILYDLGEGKGIANTLNMPLASSVKEELVVLLREFEPFNEEESELSSLDDTIKVALAQIQDMSTIEIGEE